MYVYPQEKPQHYIAKPSIFMTWYNEALTLVPQ